jgi:hypothetical protein
METINYLLSLVERLLRGDGGRNKEKETMYVSLRIDLEFEVNVAKPVTRAYGYGFFGGQNFRTRTCTHDQNPRKTRGFTFTRADH